jgi:hypothetical protein
VWGRVPGPGIRTKRGRSPEIPTKSPEIIPKSFAGCSRYGLRSIVPIFGLLGREDDHADCLIISRRRRTVPRHRPPPTADPPDQKQTERSWRAALGSRSIEKSKREFFTRRPANAQAVTNRPPTFSPPIADRARQTTPVDSGGKPVPTRHTTFASVCREGCRQWRETAPHFRATATRRNHREDRHLEGRPNRAALAATWSSIPSTTESRSPGHRGLLVPMARDRCPPGRAPGPPPMARRGGPPLRRTPAGVLLVPGQAAATLDAVACKTVGAVQ